MGRKRQKSKGKKINPTFWVFCEGETEEAYINFLKSKYRLPIKIAPKIVGNKIDERFIRNYKKGKSTHEKDRNFLIYDADVPEILEKLKNIQSTTLLASNPTIELWFLLHYKNQTAELTGNDCIKELSNRNKNDYKKGKIDNKLEKKLNEKTEVAIKRAKKLNLFNNPSSNVYKFIEALENEKSNNSK